MGSRSANSVPPRQGGAIKFDLTRRVPSHARVVDLMPLPRCLAGARPALQVTCICSSRAYQAWPAIILQQRHSAPAGTAGPDLGVAREWP